MKRITLEIEDETFRAIRAANFVRLLAGQTSGLGDALVSLIVRKIEDGVEVVEVKQKNSHD